MKYCSTRGQESGLTFEQVLFAGYANDGGLYFPESIPKLSRETLNKWRDLSYIDLVTELVCLYISEEEISREELKERIGKAYKTFPEEVVRIAKLKDGLNVAELFHGPTMTFKDLALCVVGQLYEYFLEKSGKKITIVVGTSGDTGSAAINAVKDLKNINIVVLLPKGRCTEIQERQMTTVISDNVHNFAVEGTSDDLDAPIKEVFADLEFSRKHNLCSINSINWARIMVQMGHYAYSYFQLCKEVGEEIEIVVPTGACGNITGGFLVNLMGIPVKLVAAVAPNDIVHRTLAHADFSTKQEVHASWASAIDIQIPYNMERLVYMATGCNAAKVKSLFEDFEKKGNVTIPDDILASIKTVIRDSLAVTNEEIVSTIKSTEDNYNYIVCPHTAVAVKYHLDNVNNNNNSTNIVRVCVSTAKPDKFSEVLSKAGVVQHAPSPEIEKLLQLPTKFEWMRKGQDWTKILREKIESIH